MSGLEDAKQQGDEFPGAVAGSNAQAVRYG